MRPMSVVVDELSRQLVPNELWALGRCLRACGRGHQGEQAGYGVHAAIAVYGHDRRVCDCVTNCVTITTDDHGLWWIPGDA